MQSLLERRLIIFAGKGGVGKTTSSSATAIGLAKEGRKTLLVTVDPAKRLADSLGVDVGFTETPVQPNLTAMMLDPEAVIREHLARELPQLDITEHPLFRYVTNYMPGLNELMAIGKLNDLRREGRFDVIVVDTAPTGHALSFLSAPKTIKELMSERSLIKWAIKGYAVWQQLSTTAKKFQNVFKKKEDRKDGPPEVDFERVFGDIEAEAQRIQAFLTDPDHSALVLVCLPEKLPVEETAQLYHQVTGELGMNVTHILVNKMQPDTLGDHRAAFDAIETDAEARGRFAADAAKATGTDPGLLQAMLAATAFNEIRRDMNQDHLDLLARKVPAVPRVVMPLFRRDVNGLERLGRFQEALWQAEADAAQEVEEATLAA
ncbi:MAG: ArsA family ATPase [Thermoplasmatota archaeon]